MCNDDRQKDTISLYAFGSQLSFRSQLSDDQVKLIVIFIRNKEVPKIQRWTSNMNWFKFILQVVNYIVAVGSGYEISEIISSNAHKEHEKEVAGVINMIAKAADQKGITREELAEVKIVAYAIIAVVLGAVVLGFVLAVYFCCKRCATKTVQKALEPSKFIIQFKILIFS